MASLRKSKHLFLFREEEIIFYSVLLINMAFLFATRFYPSMDGPAHLYNANLLKLLVLNNHFIADFYQISSLPIPNWTGHFILSFFGIFLPAWLAEKCLLVLYVGAMALSFRYLIKTLKPENLALSIFIFPFIYSFLFHLGFYNYSLSFIFFFLTLGYWIRHYKTPTGSFYWITAMLLLATYFSNILTYCFLGLMLGSIIVLFEAESTPIRSKQYFRSVARRIIRLTLASLPSLLLLGLFFHLVTFPDSPQQYTSSELIKWINDVRSLIVFSYTREEIITEQFFHILLFLFLFGLILNQSRRKISNTSFDARQTFIYFSVILSLILYFFIPDGSSAGMMSDRLLLMFFILFMILAITQPIPPRVQSIFSLVIVFLHLILLTKHTVTIQELNHDAVSIHKTAQYIDNHTVVLPVNLSDNWLELHFSNYLGIDKPVVILENYEANIGWFPVRWNPESPSIVLGERLQVNGLTWHQSKISSTHRPIDYIFIYGNLAKREDSHWQELNAVIDSGFTLEYESENKYIQLFKRNFEANNR